MENGNNDPNENQNNVTAADELAAVKEQLVEEQTAKAALVTEAAEKDAKIANLEASLSEVKQLSEAKDAEITTSAAALASIKVERDAAVLKYLGMSKALNPAIPADIIQGETIADIDASIAKGKTIVEAVKTAMAAEASATKVPAGAPTRTGPNLDGMTAKEKIAYGIQQKGGNA